MKQLHPDFSSYSKVIEDHPYSKFISLDRDDKQIWLILDKYDDNNFLDIISSLRKYDLLIQIKKDVIYDGSSFHQELDLSKCEFLGAIEFKNCTFLNLVKFKGTIFKGATVFEKCIFKDNVRFHWAQFHSNTDFGNTTFEKLTDFSDAQFYGPQKFYLTNFLDRTIFSNATFHDQVQFLYNRVNPSQTFISFENANFKQALDISRSNFWCRIQFWGASTVLLPNKTRLYELDDRENRPSRKLLLKRVRESFRRIKQELRSEGNNIDALKFHQYEMAIYKIEIDEHGNFEDKVALWFNRISNDFGSSWWRGVVFTLIVTLIFYITFLIFISDELVFDFCSDSIGSTIKFYIQFLNLTYWDYQPFGINNYTWGYICLFVGRIFIGYGYFQIIQAFRKHGKN